jgi:hypothetical protein
MRHLLHPALDFEKKGVWSHSTLANVPCAPSPVYAPRKRATMTRTKGGAILPAARLGQQRIGGGGATDASPPGAAPPPGPAAVVLPRDPRSGLQPPAVGTRSGRGPPELVQTNPPVPATPGATLEANSHVCNG